MRVRVFRYRRAGARYKTRWHVRKGAGYHRLIMRWARSYSILDHELLHGGYLHRMSHEALVLYLFLVVVGNREGRSFYAERSIMDILRLSGQGLVKARTELVSEGLIEYRRPYWWVLTLRPREGPTKASPPVDTAHKSPSAPSCACPHADGRDAQPARSPAGDQGARSMKDILEDLLPARNRPQGSHR